MPAWLVTGGTGFLGRHLLGLLCIRKPADVELFLIGRRSPPDASSAHFRAVDLADPEAVTGLVHELNPAVVFHLAGRTPPATAEDYYRANTLATLHLLDALRTLRRSVRVVLAGSAAELGPVDPDHLPVAEDHPCQPADSYGLSKWLAPAAGLAARPPLEVISARIFNPIGSGLPESQAFGRFAARLLDPRPDPLPLTVGDLDARRDFIDARDVAAALLALAERGRAGLVYHVGTGQSRRVGDGLDQLIQLSGRQVIVEREPRRTDGGPPSDSRADTRRIESHTGWRPEIPWEQSLADLWRAASGPLGCH